MSTTTENEVTIGTNDILLVTGTVLAIVFAYAFLKKRKRHPNEPPVWNHLVPFFGKIVDFGKNPVQFVIDGRQKFGDIFTAHILGQNMTFLTHPQAHDIFFKATDDELGLREVYRFVVPVFGNGIVYDATPTVMLEQLKFATGGIQSNRYKTFVEIFDKEVNLYLSKWGDSGELDIFHEFSQLIIITASAALLGPEIRALVADGGKFAKLYHDLDAGLNSLAFFFPWMPSPHAIKRDAARKEIHSIFQKIINERRRQAAAGEKVQYEDVLDTLMQSVYKSGTPIPDSEIVGILLVLLFAGQHTSTITSSWSTMLIASHKDIKNKVMEEQEQVMAKFDNQLTPESVKSMKYLENCIKEALRMYPPLILLMRRVKQPRSYKGFDIPVGNILVVSPAASPRCAPDIFPNPDKYDPERYTAERAEDAILPYGFSAFGGGRHKCVGENFAYLQIKSILSILFRKYDIELIGELPKVNYDSLVTGPKPPCMIRYKRRV